MAITELNEFEVAAVHGADGVTSVRKMATRARGDELVRRKLKACAEAFLAKGVIVREGKTELGIVRALEEAGRAHLSLRGVAPVDANGGAEMFKLARLVNGCGYRTCVSWIPMRGATTGIRRHCAAKGSRFSIGMKVCRRNRKFSTTC